jgi:DNA-binding NarL/FixJ family response regulator
MLEPVNGVVDAPDRVRPPPAAEAAVLLLDRRPLLREALAAALGAAWPGIAVTMADPDRIGTGRPGDSFDVCLLAAIGGQDGNARLADDLRHLARALPGVPVVVFDEEAERGPSAACAVRGGARGYFLATVGLCVLVQGMRLVALGGTALPAVGPGKDDRDWQAAGPGAPGPADPWLPVRAGLLTPRELEVLQCLGRGLPNKLIAHELGVCETTVKVHLRHLFQKLGATNRTRAALLAREMLNGPGV